VAAENVLWDFAPSGKDLLMGDAPVPTPWQRYTKWPMVRYIEYTDATFTTKKTQPAWIGMLGPVIRAVVGDTIKVHFRNRSDIPCGMHPHGVRYDKHSEGAYYSFGGSGGYIEPGESHEYTWIADEGSGPGPADPSSLVWWYHSHVDEPEEVNRGLLGPIIITAAGMADSNAHPVDVDREFVNLYMIFNRDEDRERGLMHAINGYIFGNLPGLVMNQGDNVRWHVLGMGNELDLHTAHWHANTLLMAGRRTDVVEVLPGSMRTADMHCTNPGTWLIHCHVGDHIHAGMGALYTVNPT
jgi:manganese oxidase